MSEYKVIPCYDDQKTQKCRKCKFAKATHLLEQGRMSDPKIHRHKNQWIRQALFGPYCKPCAELMRKKNTTVAA